jgi:hypothetical protein
LAFIELRTSERGTFHRCPQRWEWGIKEGLTPRRVSNPLWFGQAVHIALAEWYLPGNKRGPHPADTFIRVLEGDRVIRVPNQDDPEALDEYVDARDLGEDMLKHYVEFYGRDEDWDVIATEQTFEYWMPRLGFKKGKHIRYLGTMDGVYRDRRTGFIWLMEHKTAAGINLQHLPLDRQASSYWLVAEFILKKLGLIGPDEHIAGIMYNFMRKAMRDLRPQTPEGKFTNLPKKQHYIDALAEAGTPYHIYFKMSLTELQLLARKLRLHVLGDVSSRQPPQAFIREPVYRTVGERRRQRESIQRDAWHIERAWHDPEYPITKNPTKDCSWDCAFFRMCQLHEQGDMESVEDFKHSLFVVRDPYEDHRKSA